MHNSKIKQNFFIKNKKKEQQLLQQNNLQILNLLKRKSKQLDPGKEKYNRNLLSITSIGIKNWTINKHQRTSFLKFITDITERYQELLNTLDCLPFKVSDSCPSVFLHTLVLSLALSLSLSLYLSPSPVFSSVCFPVRSPIPSLSLAVPRCLSRLLSPSPPPSRLSLSLSLTLSLSFSLSL